MKKPGPRNVWFKLAVGLGAALGVLLLVQSVVIYFEVSKDMVVAELGREARSRVITLAQEFRQLGVQTSETLQQTIEEVQQEEPNKIAWIRVLDSSGQTVAQSGMPVGFVFNSQQVRLTNIQETPISTISDTPAGRVATYLYPFRLVGRPGPGEPAGGLRFVEIALYWNSASGDFGPLRIRMLISSFAALGLVGSMIVLWLRFPRYVHAMQLQEQAEVAQSVQADLLLAPDFALRDLDFSATCVPAWHVGGDFYDVFSAGEGCVAIAIGDVSGAGLPASVIAGVLVGAVRSSSWLAGSAEHEASSRQLNDLLHMRTSLDRFASLFWSYYEPGERVLRYVNAGHPPPILLRRNGVDDSGVERLEEGGPVLGVLPAAKYCQGAVSISPGDLLILYSDGVTEAPNASEEQFGEERLIAVIRDYAQGSAAEIRNEILKQVRSFIGKLEVQDDLTLVVVRFQTVERASRRERSRVEAVS
jgi:hypothetical protein